MKLSLCHFTLTDVDHPTFIAAAAATGVDHVCLMLKTPVTSDVGLPTVQSVAEARDIRARVDDAGLTVCNADAIFCTPDLVPENCGETLDIAATLGARAVTTLVMDPDMDVALDKMGRLADMAAERGLRIGIEFSRRNQTRNVAETAAVVRRLDRANVGVTADVLHLLRGGGSVADLANLDPAWLTVAQISDGPAEMPVDLQRDEAMAGRLYPGEGVLPLVDFVQALPDHTVLAIECPDRNLVGLSALERAQRAVAGTRAILQAAGRA